MTAFSHYPLQQAIYQTLTNDSTLIGLVVGVFDRPVQGTAFPYITIGESNGSDWSTKTTSGMQQNVTLRIWSRDGGRTQAANIMARIHALLHEVPLSVAGQTLVSIRFNGSSIILENDGWTYHGVMKFQAFLQAS